VLYSQLTANGETKEEVAKKLVDRCNELGKMQFGITEGMTELLVAELPKEVSQETEVCVQA